MISCTAILFQLNLKCIKFITNNLVNNISCDIFFISWLFQFALMIIVILYDDTK